MLLHLRIEVEALQGVDGVRVFGDVVAVESLDAAEERRSLDHRQEVGVVQALGKNGCNSCSKSLIFQVQIKSWST